jgi:hypothetical protein
VDPGPTDFLVLFNRERIAHHGRHGQMDRLEQRLRRYQRILARKQPGSAKKGQGHSSPTHRVFLGDARRDWGLKA